MNTIIDKSYDSLTALVSLQDSAKTLTSQFEDSNISSRVTDISTRLERIETSISTILSSLK